jgi:hypothetical protein
MFKLPLMMCDEYYNNIAVRLQKSMYSTFCNSLGTGKRKRVTNRKLMHIIC